MQEQQHVTAGEAGGGVELGGAAAGLLDDARLERVVGGDLPRGVARAAVGDDRLPVAVQRGEVVEQARQFVLLIEGGDEDRDEGGMSN